MKKDSGLAVVLASALASGCAGIVFSAVHHLLHWRSVSNTMDHTRSVKRLVEQGILTLRDQDHSKLSRAEAWIITSALWHQRLTTSERIKGADARTKEILDLAHSLGTAAVASFAAGIVAFVLAAANSHRDLGFWPIVRFMVAVIIGGSSFWVLHENYHRTSRFARSLIDQVLGDALTDEQKALQAKAGGTNSVITWPLFDPQVAVKVESREPNKALETNRR